jgi:hypothetical protein
LEEFDLNGIYTLFTTIFVFPRTGVERNWPQTIGSKVFLGTQSCYISRLQMGKGSSEAILGGARRGKQQVNGMIISSRN